MVRLYYSLSSQDISLCGVEINLLTKSDKSQAPEYHPPPHELLISLLIILCVQSALRHHFTILININIFSISAFRWSRPVERCSSLAGSRTETLSW